MNKKIVEKLLPCAKDQIQYVIDTLESYDVEEKEVFDDYRTYWRGVIIDVYNIACKRAGVPKSCKIKHLAKGTTLMMLSINDVIMLDSEDIKEFVENYKN